MAGPTNPRVTFVTTILGMLKRLSDKVTTLTPFIFHIAWFHIRDLYYTVRIASTLLTVRDYV